MTTSIPYDTLSTSSKTESVFTKCCCCISLKTGCFILAYLSTAVGIFQTIKLIRLMTYLVLISYIDAPEDMSLEDQQYMNTITKPFLHHITLVLLFVTCVNLAWVILCIVCLVGLHKKRPGPIRLYVLFAVIRWLLHIVGFIFLIIKTSISGTTITIFSIDLGLPMYSILVYYNYARQLERERERQATPETKPAKGYADNIAYISYSTKTDMKHEVI